MRSGVDLPIRTKLLMGILLVPLLMGLTTIVAGVFMIHSMVIGEAQRRVELGLKSARSTLEARLHEQQQACEIIADWAARNGPQPLAEVTPDYLARLREIAGFDYLHLVSTEGEVIASARATPPGLTVLDSPVLSAALHGGRSAAGLQILPARQLVAESPALAAQAFFRVLETPRARDGGPAEVHDALVMEAASPIIGPEGKVIGVVRGGLLLNRNFPLVDLIRDNVFTHATYRGRNLGTVTIFLGDVRISTNVLDPQGERAIGTRVSAEVYEQVLERGQTWVGPAFVVDATYMSAYEPIPDPSGRTIGILYVGVLQQRYDDMRVQALAIFVGITALAMLIAVGLALWLSGRLARPLVRLTAAAARVARGNLESRLHTPLRAQYDEIKRLTVAFNEMVDAIRERDEELRQSHQDLEEAAEELRRWNQNYLDTLEFITHELKNQVAAMEINLLAVRDGYVGELAPDQREALDDVVQAVNRTEEMILNYLNLSRIEKGELEVRARPISVESDVVRPVLRDLRARFDDRSMTVEVNLPEDLIVQADPSLLQIVFENLLSNAAKYAREGGLVRLWGHRLNGMVELHVWNEGPGVSPDSVGDMFRKFSRLDGAVGAERGTGLGLFITREIVTKHGGDIRAESEEGHWMDFIFTLPRPDVLLGEETEEHLG